MVILDVLGGLMIVAIVGVGTYWIINNVTIKDKGKDK